MNSLPEKAMALYCLKYSHFLEPQKGYRNYSYPVVLADSSIVNLILYKSESKILARIKLANDVSHYLYQRGLPTRHVIDPRILVLRTRSNLAKNKEFFGKNHKILPTFLQGSTSSPGARYAMLYNFLPGQTIPWDAYTRAHLKALGASLALMHKLMAKMPEHDAPSVAEQYLQIVKRMDKYFANPNVGRPLQEKLGLKLDNKKFGYFAKILEVCKKLPNQQMLHMDFVRGNVLFDEVGGRIVISGILDFEKTAYGHKLFDIARTLAFLLVDCKYKSEEEIRKNFLISGYARSGQTQLNDVMLKKTSLLETLVDMFLVYDFYKFLRHNPYESLDQNEHFVRTRNLLLQQNLLHSAGSKTVKI